jgi:hypothetical protein
MINEKREKRVKKERGEEDSPLLDLCYQQGL